jgi:hypothetical protein
MRFNDGVFGDLTEITRVRDEVERLAAEHTGVTNHMLNDGDFENHPKYDEYWRVYSDMLAQVYMCAAINLTHFSELYEEVEGNGSNEG